jgi:hypothetical protein
MKVEVRPPAEFGQLLSVYVDDVRVGIGTERVCRKLADELEADESKQKAMHDHFLLQDVMEK